MQTYKKIQKHFTLLTNLLLKTKIGQFFVIFFGTGYFAYSQTVLGQYSVCPFCGTSLSTHPMTLMIATALGAGTATVVLTMKKITYKIADFVHKKFLYKQKT